MFCQRAGDAQVAFALDDAFPVTPGHRLVAPVRHAARLEELALEEWQAVFQLVHNEARRLRSEPGVEGVNIGVNSGEAAGQTIDHAHVHVIPRRAGDVPDPRGGVRWIIPEQADYWSGR